MAHAQQCDSCGTLFKPVKGTVTLEYNICQGGNSYQGFEPDEHDSRFALCRQCSTDFLAFIKHDGERGDGKRGTSLFAADAARWRWWCRWWLDDKDDCERVNALKYQGDSQASFNAAVDAEIAKDAGKTDESRGEHGQ